MKRIRIGQIGIGNDHATPKLETLLQLPDFFEVVGVVEEANPAFPERRGQFQQVKRMTEEELLATPGLRAVALEANIRDAAAIALRCAERGMHLHVDKPAGETLEPFKSVVEKCRTQKLVLQLGYMYRANPAVQFCLKAVREGWLGEVFEIHAVMSHDYGGDAYRRYLSAYPAGTMFIFGCHLIDIVLSMLGRPDHVTSFLKATRADGVMDNGLAVLEYPRASATIRTSQVEVDGMKHRRLIVCGTKGTVELCPLEHPEDRYRLDPLHVRLTLREDIPGYKAGTHRVDCGVMNGRYADQLIEFARIVNGEISNPFSYAHELLLHETHLAACGYNPWPSHSHHGADPYGRDGARPSRKGHTGCVTLRRDDLRVVRKEACDHN
jgi:predicted dehydrogenase